ncbi:MAG TPA: Ppx/GppA phosphatase family protein [Candidatus Sulfotelmatobacter sp.]|nr:Ppx/GppA phosphatase family protein [Candidatus Sulfotelmatobacter sp.]
MPTFAAVDIGSNSVRLKIAHLQNHRLRAVHEDREVTRLGEGVFQSGFLTPESMSETVKVLRRFHRTTQQVATDSVRVVATSALRDARNSQAFLEWVRSTTGWHVEIVSGVEEARLIHLGLVSSPRIDQATTLMIDLGGGSCELTVSRGGQIRDTVSLPLGAVRLTHEFLRHDPPRKGELKRLRGFINRELGRVAARITRAHVKNVIATSGTAAALAATAAHLRKDSPTRERPSVSRAEMTRIAKRLARLPVAERRKIEGIGPRRAEIVVAGALVYQELLDRLRLRGFRFSPLGLRDGILAQMAAEYDRSTRSGRQIQSERLESINRAVQHYHVDRKHAMDVRDSAMFLFSALRSVHGLPPEYREWLSAAAMLYEVGDYVSRTGRHRHAHYIISNSEILGYTPQQRRVIAAIARYLGKSLPNAADGPMKMIEAAERGNVQKAVLLLRLGRALNLSRSRAVESVRISTRAAEVRFRLVPRRRMGVDLELWAIEKERDYFRELFGRELSTALA